MSIKKKHMNWMMLCKLPLGASLWAILFFFIFTACQDDLPYEDTEVMLTFTTRADLSLEDDEDDTDSNLQDVDRMKDLRVIMLDGDNKVVGNAIKADINKSSVVFKFSTPASHGEVFKFLAIANENSIGLENELINIVNEQDFSNYETEWKKRVISSTLNPTADNPLPQTKFWTWTYSVLGDGGEDLNPVLDYVGCKISVQFKNETNKAQSLSNIYIAGVGSGYLFKQDENDFVSDASANIHLSPIDNLPATETSEVQHCYTYPKGNISSPTLFATWNDVQYSLTLKDNQGNALTALNRNDHLEIIVTLTGQELVVNYTIAPWNTENSTNIGSPTIGGGYNTEDWTAGGDVNIGGDPVVPDEPEDPVVPGDVIELWNNDEKDLVLNNRGQDIQIDDIYVDYITAGKTLTIYYTCVPDVVWWKIDLQCNGNVILCSEFQYTSEASSKSVQLTEETAGYLKSAIESNKIVFYGNGVSITSICLE